MNSTSIVFRVLRWIEGNAARLQGKGWTSLRHEVQAADRLFNLLGVNASDVSVIVEGGGNRGDYTARVVERFVNAEVHVFEPSKANVAKLRARFDDQSRVHVVPKGLGEEQATATLHADAQGSSLGSLLPRKLDHVGIELGMRESVELETLDAYWDDVLDRRDIDLLKLDIEGLEYAALSGGREMLEATTLVQFEFGGANIDSRHYFRDFHEYFTSRGFVLFRVTPFGPSRVSRYSERDEYFTATNYIAVRAS